MPLPAKPTITPAPAAPVRGEDQTTFATKANAFVAWQSASLKPNLDDSMTWIDGANTAVEDSATSAIAAASDAQAAAAAATAVANVSEWVSGATYSVGDAVWSPVDFLTYRRSVAGAGVIDPSLDAANWTLVAGTGDVTLTGTQTLTNKTLSGVILNDGYTEEVFALATTGSIALDPANGSIQTCALTGDPTFTDSLATGQSIVLMLTNGASWTVTWPTTTWVGPAGNVPPTLTASDVLVFWKVGATLYGATVGSAV